MLEARHFGLPETASVAAAPHRSIVSLAAFAGRAAALADALGVALPEPNKRAVQDEVSFLWSGPDSWLVMSADSRLENRLAAKGRAFAAVTDQSDGRAIFMVSGDSVRDTMAKLVPIDLHETVFGPDDAALTLAGHIPVQIWREEGAFALACFRSYAGALHHALLEAAGEGRG
jgi:sarcosine oxidase subunit gamma